MRIDGLAPLTTSAIFEESDRFRAAACWRLRSLPWWITALILVGSVAFGVSAVASFVVPTTGLPRNIVLVNLCTFVRALCLLVGAVMLLPELTESNSD